METLVSLSWLIPLLPLLGAAIVGATGRNSLRGNSHLPIWATVGTSAVLSLLMLVTLFFGSPNGTVSHNETYDRLLPRVIDHALHHGEDHGAEHGEEHADEEHADEEHAATPVSREVEEETFPILAAATEFPQDEPADEQPDEQAEEATEESGSGRATASPAALGGDPEDTGMGGSAASAESTTNRLNMLYGLIE